MDATVGATGSSTAPRVWSRDPCEDARPVGFLPAKGPPDPRGLCLTAPGWQSISGARMEEARSRRSDIAVFVVRVLALGGLGASCILTIGEDRKEVRMVAPRDADPDVDAKAFEPPPPPNFVFGDASVVDTETRLEWQREMAEARLSWADAKSYCKDLALDGGKWRLPSRPELLTVLKHWHDPLGGGHDWFWSADVGVREGTAWAIGSDSWLNGNPVETKSRVRCVRDASEERQRAATQPSDGGARW